MGNVVASPASVVPESFPLTREQLLQRLEERKISLSSSPVTAATAIQPVDSIGKEQFLGFLSELLHRIEPQDFPEPAEFVRVWQTFDELVFVPMEREAKVKFPDSRRNQAKEFVRTLHNFLTGPLERRWGSGLGRQETQGIFNAFRMLEPKYARECICRCSAAFIALALWWMDLFPSEVILVLEFPFRKGDQGAGHIFLETSDFEESFETTREDLCLRGWNPARRRWDRAYEIISSPNDLIRLLMWDVLRHPKAQSLDFIADFVVLSSDPGRLSLESIFDGDFGPLTFQTRFLDASLDMAKKLNATGDGALQSMAEQFMERLFQRLCVVTHNYLDPQRMDQRTTLLDSDLMLAIYHFFSAGMDGWSFDPKECTCWQDFWALWENRWLQMWKELEPAYKELRIQPGHFPGGGLFPAEQFFQWWRDNFYFEEHNTWLDTMADLMNLTCPSVGNRGQAEARQTLAKEESRVAVRWLDANLPQWKEKELWRDAFSQIPTDIRSGKKWISFATRLLGESDPSLDFWDQFVTHGLDVLSDTRPSAEDQLQFLAAWLPDSFDLPQWLRPLHAFVSPLAIFMASSDPPFVYQHLDEMLGEGKTRFTLEPLLEDELLDRRVRRWFVRRVLPDLLPYWLVWLNDAQWSTVPEDLQSLHETFVSISQWMAVEELDSLLYSVLLELSLAGGEYRQLIDFLSQHGFLTHDPSEEIGWVA